MMRLPLAMPLLAACITFDGGGQTPPGDAPPSNDVVRTVCECDGFGP